MSRLPVTVNQPSNVSFTGPIHTIQFDHNGGTFQSPIHKVSLVVPPNALGDGEKVTVYMGATTSGPFDLPEDCKLRSAVVWLSVSPSDVVFKRSVSVILPHSTVDQFDLLCCVECEDFTSSEYKFSYSSDQFTHTEQHGCIEMKRLFMVAIVTRIPSQSWTLWKSNKIPLAHYLVKLFWPRRELPRTFRADIYYIQNLPTELYKVMISRLTIVSHEAKKKHTLQADSCHNLDPQQMICISFEIHNLY